MGGGLEMHLPFLGRGTLGSGWQRQMELGAFHLVFWSVTEFTLGWDGLLSSLERVAMERERALGEAGMSSTERSLSCGEDTLWLVRRRMDGPGGRVWTCSLRSLLLVCLSGMMLFCKRGSCMESHWAGRSRLTKAGGGGSTRW